MSKRNKHKARRDRRPGQQGIQDPLLQLGIEVQEIQQRRFKKRWQKKSELEISNPIETDTRHYCKFCKRKRDERFMHVVGSAAFGKKSWACADDFKVCQAIQTAKAKELQPL